MTVISDLAPYVVTIATSGVVGAAEIAHVDAWLKARNGL